MLRMLSSRLPEGTQQLFFSQNAKKSIRFPDKNMHPRSEILRLSVQSCKGNLFFTLKCSLNITGDRDMFRFYWLFLSEQQENTRLAPLYFWPALDLNTALHEAHNHGHAICIV